ncbi:hypothetical protein K458DRAFT_456199 [Lentithecium fluviatile CBS 122367]|uniref:Uncharacterized protein n=1 Tax=Lentithecium fluviatile CBS 122367 TaxID=1168545 RepID=A0A6G1IV45_9PLEO|nr:hypothetical protein K458DRAFT_456199 [Lentithecium fluviatile CBS 122367]
MAEPSVNNGVYGRVRRASVSVLNANPQLGMWQATGTPIARAPNLAELRGPGTSGDKIAFNSQGHSARITIEDSDGELVLVKSVDEVPSRQVSNIVTSAGGQILPAEDQQSKERHAHRSLRKKHHQHRKKVHSICEKHIAEIKEKLAPTIMKGLKAF